MHDLFPGVPMRASSALGAALFHIFRIQDIPEGMRIVIERGRGSSPGDFCGTTFRSLTMIIHDLCAFLVLGRKVGPFFIMKLTLNTSRGRIAPYPEMDLCGK